MDYKITPWAHQLRAQDLARPLPHFALFFEQGCGKTATLINVLREKYAHTGLQSTLILCPQIVIENWKREILAHSDFRESQIRTLTGSGWERVTSLEHVLTANRDCIVITNYETLNMGKVYAGLLKWRPYAVVLDESHKCKDISAQRTKKAIELSKTASLKYILSGTPVVNSPFDIFPQFLFLDGGQTFPASYNQFRDKYFTDHNARRRGSAGYFPDWQPREGALQEMNRLIYRKAMRVMKSECLDLPPLVRQIVDVDLSDEQRRIYRELETDAVSYVTKEKVVSADLAIKKALRLQQVTTGFVKNDDDEIHVFHGNPRIQALEEVLDSIEDNHKVIIWAVFKQNYDDIRRLLYRMKIGFVEVHGEVEAKRKQENVDAFNSPRGTARVLLGHPRSAGIGVNLVSASYAIFYSRGFSLEDDLQAEARNYRGGSEVHQKVTRIDLVARNTVDETVLTALSSKLDVSEAILKYMKGRK